MLNKVPVEMIDYDFGKLPSLDNVYTKDQTYSKGEVYNKTEVDELLEESGGLDYPNKAWLSSPTALGWVIFTFEQDTTKPDGMTRIQAIIEGTGWGGATGGAPFKLSLYGMCSGDGSSWKPSCTLLTNGTTDETHPVCYQKDGALIKVAIWVGTGSAGFIRAKTNSYPSGNHYGIKDVTYSVNTSDSKPLKYELTVTALGGSGVTPESLNVYTKDQTYNKEEVDSKISASGSGGSLSFKIENSEASACWYMLKFTGAGSSKTAIFANIIIDGVGFNVHEPVQYSNFRLSISLDTTVANSASATLLASRTFTPISSASIYLKAVSDGYLVCFMMGVKSMADVRVITSDKIRATEYVGYTVNVGALPNWQTYTKLDYTKVTATI